MLSTFLNAALVPHPPTLRPSISVRRGNFFLLPSARDYLAPFSLFYTILLFPFVTPLLSRHHFRTIYFHPHFAFLLTFVLLPPLRSPIH